jgi:ABC-type uncharacterized transport system permease subunit
MMVAWSLLVLGILVFTAGLVLQFLLIVSPFDPKILSGLGIFLAGLGISQVLRYRIWGGNSQAVNRLVNEELDERNRLIRAQAGNRAFWVSMVMTYSVLLWISFSTNEKLPVITPDGMWWLMAVAFLVPFGVYIIGIVIDQNR